MSVFSWLNSSIIIVTIPGFVIALFDSLYEWCCRTSTFLEEVGERKLYGPELVRPTTKNIKVIRENLKIVHNR